MNQEILDRLTRHLYHIRLNRQQWQYADRYRQAQSDLADMLLDMLNESPAAAVNRSASLRPSTFASDGE